MWDICSIMLKKKNEWGQWPQINPALQEFWIGVARTPICQLHNLVWGGSETYDPINSLPSFLSSKPTI